MATINNGGRMSAQDLANLIAIVQNPNLFGLTQQEYKEITAVIRSEALAISRISMNANLHEDFDFGRTESPNLNDSGKLEYQPGVFNDMQHIPEYDDHQKLSF